MVLKGSTEGKTLCTLLKMQWKLSWKQHQCQLLVTFCLNRFSAWKLVLVSSIFWKKHILGTYWWIKKPNKTLLVLNNTGYTIYCLNILKFYGPPVLLLCYVCLIDLLGKLREAWLSCSFHIFCTKIGFNSSLLLTSANFLELFG